MKILVTYFTASGAGRTKKLAERFAQLAEADLYEITPEVPYTKADIKYTNPLSRCNKEWIGKKDVPVSGSVEGFEDYDVVLIGYPVWYNSFPNVVATFAKGYDWSGKKVGLFATSGGSGIGKAADRFASIAKGDVIVSGAERFDPDATEAELTSWIKEITE